MNVRLWCVRLAATLYGCGFLMAQSTQSHVTGRVTDYLDGLPVANAVLTVDAPGQVPHRVLADAAGLYAVSGLSPGRYRFAVSAAGYQSWEQREVDIPVSALLELNFPLRALDDVWERGMRRSILPQGGRTVLTFIGPDLDAGRMRPFLNTRASTLGFETAGSTVIDRRALQHLPLSGRDAYTFLALIGGVTADGGTARGLGLSAHGQRPSATTFLLDGVENNNDLITGPLNLLPPEAIQEYRVSTGLFTAEYGRSSGIVANAVSLSGGDSWHGMGYFYANHEAWNANSFQRNQRGISRAKRREQQPGLVLGGPIVRSRLYASLAAEYVRNRTEDEPQEFLLPTSRYAQFLIQGGAGRALLDRFRAPFADRNLVNAPVTLSPPNGLDRRLGLLRAEYVAGRSRLFGRLLHTDLRRPYFIWTPYPDFVTPMGQRAWQYAGGMIGMPSPSMTTELRVSLATDNLHWDRRYPGIPTLESDDGTVLPGSPAFYSYRNGTRRWEVTGNLSWSRSGHIVKAGGSYLGRRIGNAFAPGRDGRYRFDGFFEFGAGQPSVAEALVLRESDPLTIAGGDRQYTNQQFAWFAQDTWRVRDRLTLNAGLRYEFFGSPRSLGRIPDFFVAPGRGQTLPERIASAGILSVPAGTRPLFDSDRNNFAPRVGFSLRLTHSPRLFLRGSYGIYYDRPFDNLWQNAGLNGFQFYQRYLPFSFRASPALPDLLSSLRGGDGFSQPFPELVFFQPGLRTAYVQSSLLGLSWQVSDGLVLEAGVSSAAGRKLLTTDRLNRPFSTPETDDGRWNSQLPTLAYRANQGNSNYQAFSLSASHTSSQFFYRAAYTWSHSIDNQSEPLAGDFFDLSFTGVNLVSEATTVAAFSEQMNSRADRGNSDFDQRHSVTGWGSWEIWRGLRIASVAAWRSGLPFTVFAPLADAPALYNRRAQLISRDSYGTGDVEGGRRWLNPLAFDYPPFGRQGNLGRNSLRGPGQFNADVSLSRAFPLRALGESGRLVCRVDFYNVLNHVNLGAVDPYLDSPTFGQATYGRVGRRGFPALAPFQENARTAQGMIQVFF